MTDMVLPANERLWWIDFETTCISPEEGLPLELGIRVTDLDLNTIDERSWRMWSGRHEALWTKLIELADNGHTNAQWVVNQHLRSKLIMNCVNHGISESLVSVEAVAWLRMHDVSDKEPLVGSTVQFDIGWLRRHLPYVANLFHYRGIDNSSTKELCKRYNPELYAKLEKLFVPKKLHRVLDDLDDSIAEFKFYKDNFLYI